MNSNVRPDTMERITTKDLADKFIKEQVEAVRAQVGDKKVLLALSGGVDSSVVAALLIKAIGKQLVCVHVNHGLMRKGESEQVIEVFGKELDANLIYIDATDRFLDLLKDVAEPEKKRKIIGGEFIKVFDEEAAKLLMEFLQVVCEAQDFLAKLQVDNLAQLHQDTFQFHQQLQAKHYDFLYLKMLCKNLVDNYKHCILLANLQYLLNDMEFVFHLQGLWQKYL